MKLITPVIVTDSVLTTSTVPETDYAAWNAGTAYVVGNRVIRTTTHSVYERLIAGTTATAPESDTTNWVFVSATNRWKMFDQKGGSQTVQATEIKVTLLPGKVVNSIALLLLEATSVRVRMIDPIDGVVYDETITLTSTQNIVNWWRYFFEPIARDLTVVLTNLPAYGTASIEVTVTNTTSDAKIGSCIVGVVQTIGEVQYGASVGIQDYSIKQRDGFGNINIVPRSYTDRARFTVRMPSNETDKAKRILTAVRTTPTLFSGSDLFDSTVIYGFYKDFDIVFTSFPYSDCSIEIEGLV